MMIANIKDVFFSYDNCHSFVLKNTSLKINAGQHIVVVGKNGAGKSTLAKIVAGLISPDKGYVELFGKVCFCEGNVNASNYASVRKKIAFVSQHPDVQLLCENVASDVAFVPQNLEMKQAAIDTAVLRQLKKAGLEKLAEKNPAQLSGGEQQLVALASAVVCEPELLVLDEPTAYLDERNTQHFLRLLEKCAGKTTIFHVAHKKCEQQLCDEVIEI